MGLYDTVYLRYPGCGAPAEFQGKEGECAMLSVRAVERRPPPDIEEPLPRPRPSRPAPSPTVTGPLFAEVIA
jgi:hypothetical protein